MESDFYFYLDFQKSRRGGFVKKRPYYPTKVIVEPSIILHDRRS